MHARRAARCHDVVLHLSPQVSMGVTAETSVHPNVDISQLLRDHFASSRASISQAQQAISSVQSIENHILQEQCTSLRAIVDQAQQGLSSLQSIYNHVFPPASFLPPETLTEILAYLYDSSPNPFRNRSFLSALLTCKQWHNVAIEVSRFWTSFGINNAITVKIYLQRSGVSPLSLTLEHGPIANSEEVVSLLKPHAQRIHSLVAHYRKPRELEDFLNSLDLPAPNLEILRVSNVLFENVNLTGLFAGVMPSLRTLHLTLAWLPVSPSWARRLQELTLRHVVFTLPDILNLLAECSALQILTIEGYETWKEAESVPANTVIRLPKLQRLDLQTYPISATSYFLSHLLLPQSATLRMATDVELEQDHNMDMDSWFDTPDLNNANNLPCVMGLKRLEMLWAQHGTIIIRGYRNAEEYVNPDVEIELENAGTFGNIPAPHPQWLDISAVEVLVIQMGKDYDEFYPQDILYALPNLKLLRVTSVEDYPVADLVHALASVSHVTPATQAETFDLCPRLETLELFDFRWTNRFAGKLVQMIEKRKQGGSMLQSVEIYGAIDGPVEEEMHVAWSDEEPPFVVKLHADA